MEHTPEIQKQYFQFAYQTGSDIWTHIPYHFAAERILPAMERDAVILDIGAGRGVWVEKMVSLGYKVIGIDYVENIVKKANEKIQSDGYSDRARFMVGDATKIPFVDNGFHMITDIGTFQHLTPDMWPLYLSEVSRVIKDHGYYLNVSLSKETKRFYGWNPVTDQDTTYNKFGVHYHFFKNEDISDIFGEEFVILDQKVEHYKSQSDPADDVALVFTVMQKKNLT